MRPETVTLPSFLIVIWIAAVTWGATWCVCDTIEDVLYNRRARERPMDDEPSSNWHEVTGQLEVACEELMRERDWYAMRIRRLAQRAGLDLHWPQGHTLARGAIDGGGPYKSNESLIHELEDAIDELKRDAAACRQTRQPVS